MALLSMVHKTTLMFWQNWIRCYLESRIYFTPETNYSLLHLKACLFENVKYIPVVPEEVYLHLHILQVRTPLLVTVPQSPVDTGAHLTGTTNISYSYWLSQFPVSAPWQTTGWKTEHRVLPSSSPSSQSVIMFYWQQVILFPVFTTTQMMNILILMKELWLKWSSQKHWGK